MKKRILHILLPFLPVFFLFGACARVGAPPGGPKDITPPRPLEYDPPDYSVFFDAPVIEIRFNEFIQLDQVNKKLIVSPPLTEKPEIRLKGKTMIIRLNNTLRDSTTYTLNFADAIKDFTEGNILENFTYVFSTGSYIDSLQVHGQLLEAADLTPPEDALVMLYDNLSDSAPLLQKPLYVSKANQYGMFVLKNLKADTFRLYGLVDGNLNYLYDPGGDEVAFLDTVIILAPGPDYAPFPDSLITDSIYSLPGRNFLLRLFTEETAQQYLKSYDRPLPEFLFLIFNRPARGAVISLADTTVPSWFLAERSVTGDTLGLWITDTALVHSGRLRITATYEAADSLGRPVTVTDTVSLRIKPKKGSKGKKQKTEETPVLSVNTSLSHNRQELNSDLLLETSAPLAGRDTSLIRFVRMEDSLEIPQPYTLEKDTFFLRRLHLRCPWQESTGYVLEFLPGAFTDIYGLTNDTVRLEFHTASLEDYGNLVLNLTSPGGEVVIQMWDDNEKKRIREASIHSDTTLRFGFLKPGKYILKAFADENGNGKWDPGILLEKKQPEAVAYFNKILNIKANWDMEESWDILFDFRMNPFRHKK